MKLKYVLVTLCLLNHFSVSAKHQVNVFCEISVEETVDGKASNVLKKVPLKDKTIDADWHADDKTYRVGESKYAHLAYLCDQQNAHAGKVLPSIMAYVGSYLPFGSSYLPLGSKKRKKMYQKAKDEANAVKRDPNKTMVIFFHGTGSNPLKDAVHQDYPAYDGDEGGGELLSYLRNRMIEDGAEEGKDFISVHGAGSGNAQVPNFHTKYMFKDSYSNEMGNLAGSGTAENVENSILHLKAETSNPAMEEVMAKLAVQLKSIGKIIVIGWSRGSVTAIQFAHDLYKDKDLKSIDLHMFVIDPVPGLGNMTFGAWKNIFHLYPNVKNYFGLYAEHERSYGFTPVVPRVADSASSFFSKDKKMIVAEMPGAHGTLVGNLWDDKFKTDANANVIRRIPVYANQARINRALAQVFIVTHGGHLTGIKYFADRGAYAIRDIDKFMLVDFDAVAEKLADFDILKTKSYTFGQLLEGDRKFHQDWNVFGNFKMLNDWVQPVLPRYTSKDIKGFKKKHDIIDGERIWVNHLHKVLQVQFNKKKHFDVAEFFNPNYYSKYKKQINRTKLVLAK